MLTIAAHTRENSLSKYYIKATAYRPHTLLAKDGGWNHER